MQGDGDNGPVVAWFGPAFEQLHPWLQQLHRRGGRLQGEVLLAFGGGLAGVFGRRLARRLGIPDDAGRHVLDVDISHDGASLLWDRRFNARTRMASVFHPVGAWPEGYWIERTGPVEMHLGVEIVDGGWCWRLRRLRVHGVPVPLWSLPRPDAGKRIVDGRYRFFVGFSLPGLGAVLSYGGDLTPVA